jgi:hypothetical protein
VLPPGDVDVRVDDSTLYFMYALAVTFRCALVR